MKNLIKLTSLAVFTMLIFFGSLTQIEAQCGKKEDAKCCSSKDVNGKMSEKNMMDCKSFDKNNNGIIYECPMKCEAPSDVAGTCSKCGMNLKEVSVKENQKKIGDAKHKMMNHSKMSHSSHMNKGKVELTSLDKNNDGIIYECPMKCEAPSDEAGTCSKCGMNLKEVSIKDVKVDLTGHKH